MEAGSSTKYRRLKEIGRGAYGMIYLAEITNIDLADEESEEDKYVALKKLLTNVLWEVTLGQDRHRVQFHKRNKDPERNQPSEHHKTEGCVCGEQSDLLGNGLYGQRSR
jgi:hypothetical protein